MIREEAIKQLKDNRALCINSETEPFAAAYDMAIKALEQDSILNILNKLKAEIEQTEINGHIRDVECFRAGINVALNVIDKCKAGE